MSTRLALPGRFRPWRTHPRETLGFLLLGASAMVAAAGAGDAMPRWSDAPTPAEAAPIDAKKLGEATLPSAVRDLTPVAAQEANAAIPVATGPNPAATAFQFRGGAEDRARALECLTSAIYYEAGQESDDGQRAVAQVVLNRVRHPAYPNSVCAVVYEGSTRTTGCQFTFTCDGSLSRAPMESLWRRAQRVAADALAGAVYAPVGNATHYHANYVVPYWAASLAKVRVEGAHIFYRWPGGWGRPAAFSMAHAGREPSPRALKLAALAAPHAVQPTRDMATAELPKGVVVVSGPQRGVIAKFHPEARAAADKAVVTPYVERVAASDNLRYALGGSESVAEEAPLGAMDKAAQ